MATNFLTFEHAFYTGDYAAVLGAEVERSERVDELQVRALLAQGQAQAALTRLEGRREPVFAALRAYAQGSAQDADAVLDGEAGSSSASDDDAVRHIVALVHASQGDLARALDVLQPIGESLDGALLRVHILLALNRVADAQRVVEECRKWANDHVVFNMAEAWTSLRTDAAQKAYFIFEENNSLLPTPASSLGEAVAQLEMRRFPEAEEAMKPALADDDSTAVVISALALALLQGQSANSQELVSKLKLAKHAQSPFVTDLRAKEELFDRVAAKFQ